ncbi:hypothetical protein F4808DRAFT_434582 [Astrocystis sublimbata]|nr:hypothetical protein F4808DRAFT_434582 [Astrocystis sublimbata]
MSAAVAMAPALASELPAHRQHHHDSDHLNHGANTDKDADRDAHHAKSKPQSESHSSPKPTGLHSPPDSNGAMKLDGSDDDSELSDVEDPLLDPDQLSFFDMPQPTPPPAAEPAVEPEVEPEPAPAPEDEDIGDVTPDHWSGTVPVFKPDMRQFKDFKKFMEKVDSYGMKSGILKIIPPQEWKDNLPVLDDLVKQIRVREPIKQEIMGSNGTYRQVNILHQRAYNLPQWRQLCDQSEHQPPARRGERRAQAPTRTRAAPNSSTSAPRRRGAAAATTGGSGRATRSRTKKGGAKPAAVAELEDRPMTPVSPAAEGLVESVEQDVGEPLENDDPAPPTVGRMGGSRQAKPKEQSTSARRKFARREGSARIDEEAFKDFDYQMDITDYTPERCEELERIYWKTLTYAPPLYGADVLGTLFNENTESWNLNKLPNLLDVLGTKVPGVNTAYLYLGMWKATFAWHLEDVDLYSINYLHFGAPKQWYSISQGDARRFEAAMKSIWPTDAKACDQFLRHKAFLISPNHLQQYFNIKVNKCVSYPGEFVVTYPYGYHSGYNLGYNCAEAVNFALDSWLPLAKIAKKCECAQAQDSVWVDVYEIERKLRGEETDYEETEDEEDEEEDEDDLEVEGTLRSSTIKFKTDARKRKRGAADKAGGRVKKIRLRLKTVVEPPCCLCPHDIPGFELLPTDNDRKAHRLCALYGAETWIDTVDDKEIVANVANISKDRLDLKCLFCRSKKGTCFQCSHKKCARSYHATCAAAAGVFVEEAEIPIFGEDGTEYKEQAFEFTCRFHRTKRDRKLDGDALESDQKICKAASALKKGDICQVQYSRGEIFAGIIVENRDDEQSFLLDVIPNGERIEVEWKWLILPEPADYHLPRASQNAIPMPTSRKAKDLINATRRRIEEPPRAEEPFVDGGFVWAEFNHHELEVNKLQAKVDLSNENQIWYYLGRTSTEARPQYTEDPSKRQHNCKSNFLDTIPRPVAPPPQPRKSYGSTFSIHTPVPAPKSQKPYQYKPRDPTPQTFIPSPFTAQQFVPKPSPFTTQQFEPSASPSTTSFQYAQYTNRPANFSTHPQPPIPAALPYYTFQHSPYRPPAQQAQRARKVSHTQPSTPLPQQGPPQTPQGSLPQATHQHASQIQQATSQPTPNFTPQPAGLAQQPQSSAPQYTTSSFQQYGGQTAHTTPVPGSQPISRRSSMQRPTPPRIATGHTRNKSSVSSHSGRFPLGSGQRFGTPPASYGHSRGDSMTKSPFSHGFSQPPGLGPSPSPQNSQFFQTQARARSGSLVSNISLNTPMTSSAIRPSSSSASAQALAGQLQSVVASAPSKELRPSIIQKYAFFQMHHNRDSTTYKTPYATYGGFTNGYEGNLRAHLMQTPDALFSSVRKQSNVGLSGTGPGLSPSPYAPVTKSLPSAGASDPMQQSRSPVMQHSSAATPTPTNGTQIPLSSSMGSESAPPRAKEPSSWDSNSVGEPSHWNVDVDAGAPLHPAIRAHYAAMLPNRNIKVETHSDVGSAAQPLGMSSQLPSTPSPHPSMATRPAPTTTTSVFSPSTPAGQSAPAPAPAPAPSTTTPIPAPAQVQQTRAQQPKSTTPIPPPPVPVSNTQRTATPSSSAKLGSSVPKKTHIPAPRPWEALQKMQTTPGPSMPAQPLPSAHNMATPSPAPMTTGSQPRPGYSVPGSAPGPPQFPALGFQPNQVVQSANPGASTVSQPAPTATAAPVPPAASPAPVPYVQFTTPAGCTQCAQCAQAVAVHPLPAADLAGRPSGATDVGQQPAGVAYTPAPSVATSNQAGGTPDLPEVLDGSMELVESIIRNAQIASETFG